MTPPQPERTGDEQLARVKVAEFEQKLAAFKGAELEHQRELENNKQLSRLKEAERRKNLEKWWQQYMPTSTGPPSTASVASSHTKISKVILYSNPLGKACYNLDLQAIELCLNELKRGPGLLLIPALVWASQIVPFEEDRKLTAQEVRHFQHETGCPPLLLACVACEARLKRIREEHRQEKNPESPVLEAEKDVQLKTVEVVRLLTKNGARISATDVGPGGNSALHVAARCGAKHLLSALLRDGGDILVKNNDGLTAEQVASQSGNVICEEMLFVLRHVAKEEEVMVQPCWPPKGPGRKKDKKQRKSSRAPTSGQGKSKSSKVTQDGSSGKAKAENRKTKGKKAKEEEEEEEEKVSSGEDSSEEDREATGTHEASFTHQTLFKLLQEDEVRREEQKAPKEEEEAEEEEATEEWDTARWGEYEDWGADWDEDAADSASEPAGSSAGEYEDEDEVRAEVERLRKEKRTQSQQLYDMATEREAMNLAIEQTEKRAKRLEEQARRLEEREALVKAGDARAASDIADEAEVSALWESCATTHAQTVWELEKVLARQQKEQQEAVLAAEKELRALRRRTKGLERFWDHRFAWEMSKEMLERMTAEHQSSQLTQEIRQLSRSLDVHPNLKAQLPPLVVAGTEDSSTLELLPLEELVVSVQVHQRLQAVCRSQEAALEELIDFCNDQLRVKDDELLTTLEQQLIHRFRFLRGQSEQEYLAGWQRMSQLCAQTREALELAVEESRRQTSPGF